MDDSEKTKVGSMRVLAQNNFQVVINSRGFTLVELIMVVVIISILAVSVVRKFLDTSGFSLAGATSTFNSLGEPTAGGGSSVTLSAGAETKTITVESYTGRVSSS